MSFPCRIAEEASQAFSKFPSGRIEPDDSSNLNPQCFGNSEDHAFAIMQHVVISDAEYPQTFDGFQIALAFLILEAAIVMAPAIELHNQSVRLAVEIDDVGTHGMLTAKLDSQEPSIANQAPENLFGDGGILSKQSRPRPHVVGGRIRVSRIFHVASSRMLASTQLSPRLRE